MIFQGLFLANFIYSATIVAPVNPASQINDFEEFPHETQSAQCTITAGDVQASAQATISKKLEGVCGSSSYPFKSFFSIRRLCLIRNSQDKWRDRLKFLRAV